jgi:NADH:ubiquinone oxidoreductase subunit K
MSVALFIFTGGVVSILCSNNLLPIFLLAKQMMYSANKAVIATTKQTEF